MNPVAPSVLPSAPSLFRDVVLPKEHGSWSLALEPITLGMLIAPSAAGAALSLALLAVFFARRPLRLALSERRPERRQAAYRALVACAGVAGAALLTAVVLGGVAWLVWLLPVGLAGAVFASLDSKGSGREEAAEVAGSAAFALVPAALAILGGMTMWSAVALAVLALGRSVPSVLCVRAYLRAKKMGVRRDGPALMTALGAALLAAGLYAAQGVPFFAVIALAVFAFRAAALLTFFRPDWRAKRVGMMEAGLGATFVVGLAVSWAL